MKVYVTTSDPNVFIVPTFAYLFNKYWDDSMEVKVLGFTPPNKELPKNFEFVSMAPEQKGAAANWSTYLIDYFSSIEDDYMVLMIEDHLIARPVDKELFNILQNMMNPNIARIGLHYGIQHGRHPADILECGQVGGYDLIELAQHPKVHNYLGKLTGQPSIWNRRYFLSTIQRGWSPWQWEIEGDKATYDDGFRVLATKDKWCVRKIEALANRVMGTAVNLTFLEEEDISYIKNNALVPSDRKIITHEDWDSTSSLFRECFDVPWASI